MREPTGSIRRASSGCRVACIAAVAFTVAGLATACDKAGERGRAEHATDLVRTATAGEVMPASAAAGAVGGLVPGAALGADGEWVTQGKDYGQTRYSPLAEITPANVGSLTSAWSFATGTLQGNEGAPLVVGQTLYIVTPFPDNAYALDPVTGAIKWTFHPNTDPWSIGIACCDVVDRGWSYADGKLIYNLLDNRTIALDAKTGRELWETKLGDVKTGMTMTMAPLVVHQTVYVGNSGGEMGQRGFIAALDLGTGALKWKAYNTGSDHDVMITANTRPFYAKDRGVDLGLHSWPPDGWIHGGATVWAWVSYDPETNAIIYGTSNPGPWNQDQRPGANMWSSTVFARDPATGEARWLYQVTPHDLWDYDAVNEWIAVDRVFNGTLRQLLVHFDRNAYAYTMDRRTGEVLVARPFAYQNWSTGFDSATGTPIVNPDKRTMQGVNVTDICPPDLGGKDEDPAAYSAATGLFYVPVNHLCEDYEGYESSFIAGTPYWGAKMTRYPAPGGYRGEFIAWDAIAGRRVWEIHEPFPVYSGVLTTASNLVFYGTIDGWFKAVDARTGKLLWKTRTSSGIIGAPMTYRGADGRQYVAVLSGTGGAMSTQQNVQGYLPPGGTLNVYALPQPAVPNAAP